MRSADLAAELIAAQQALTTMDRQTLTAASVPQIAIDLGLVGALNIELDRPGHYWQPLVGGVRTFIVPVRVDDPASPESADPMGAVQFGGIIDLIAWRPDFPGRWAARTGLADWLGAIQPQLLDPAPVRVWRSPLGWLRAGGEGLCVLARELRQAQRLLLACHRIEAEDFAAARELRRILERPFQIPPITISSAQRRRAA